MPLDSFRSELGKLSGFPQFNLNIKGNFLVTEYAYFDPSEL